MTPLVNEREKGAPLGLTPEHWEAAGWKVVFIFRVTSDLLKLHDFIRNLEHISRSIAAAWRILISVQTEETKDNIDIETTDR